MARPPDGLDGTTVEMLLRMGSMSGESGNYRGVYRTCIGGLCWDIDFDGMGGGEEDITL